MIDTYVGSIGATLLLLLLVLSFVMHIVRGMHYDKHMDRLISMDYNDMASEHEYRATLRIEHALYDNDYTWPKYDVDALYDLDVDCIEQPVRVYYDMTKKR